MKNKPRFYLVFLLCIGLILGIGYAALTDSLNVNGKATYFAQASHDREVKFVGFYNLKHCRVSLDAVGSSAQVDAYFTDADADATGLCTATVTLIILNNSDEDLKFTNPGDIVCNDTFFDVVSDWTEDKVIPADTKVEITLTVTAHASALSADHHGTFTVQIPATSVAP